MEDTMYLNFVCNFRIFIGQIVLAPRNSRMSEGSRRGKYFSKVFILRRTMKCITSLTKLQ
jgi:hypothetical protein